jgi:hypothetical protein
MSKYNIGNDNNFKRNIFFPNGWYFSISQ